MTLSWWGVHTVMSGTAYDPPLAVPLAAQPPASARHLPSPDAPSPSDSPRASPSPSSSASASATPSAAGPTPKAPAPAPRPAGESVGGQGQVKGYTVSGGRVVFDLGPSSAELVSATPEAGWRIQVWKQDFWIRVTFTRDGREASVFCTWHDHPPMVELVDP